MKSICLAFLLLTIYALCTNAVLFGGKKDGAKGKPAKKEKCMIVKGKGKNFVGDTIFVHKEFVPTLKKIDTVAKQCGIKLAMKGSYEQIPDPTKAVKFSTANGGKHIKFIIMDKTGKKLICNNVCLAKEGEKIPEVKCLVTGLRKENLRYGPHGETGTLDDASDMKPGFADIARHTQEACKGAKL